MFLSVNKMMRYVVKVKWVTDNRTFIGGPCNKCGGCGEQLDTYGRTVCKNDNTKWCWGIDHPRGNCDSTP